MIYRKCEHIRITDGGKTECGIFGKISCERCSYYKKLLISKKALAKDTESEKSIKDERNTTMKNNVATKIYELEKFTPVILTGTELRIYISKNAVMFSKGVMKKLGNPEYIEIGINEEERKLAVMACSGGLESAICCRKDSGIRRRFWNRELWSIITELTICNPNQKFCAYYVGGRYSSNGVIVFDFTKPIAVKNGNLKRKSITIQPNQSQI